MKSVLTQCWQSLTFQVGIGEPPPFYLVVKLEVESKCPQIVAVAITTKKIVARVDAALWLVMTTDIVTWVYESLSRCRMVARVSCHIYIVQYYLCTLHAVSPKSWLKKYCIRSDATGTIFLLLCVYYSLVSRPPLFLPSIYVYGYYSRVASIRRLLQTCTWLIIKCTHTVSTYKKFAGPWGEIDCWKHQCNCQPTAQCNRSANENQKQWEHI